MDVRVGLWSKLSAKELMLLNCGVGEDSWESLGLQRGPTSPFWRRLDPGISLEGMMLKLKLQYFGHLMQRVDSLKKTPTEDEMARWHDWLDGRESEWTLGVGDGEGGLACCNSWSRKESDTTEWLNWTDWIDYILCSKRWRSSIHSAKSRLGSVISSTPYCQIQT